MHYPVARPSVSLSARISPEFVPAELATLDQWQVRRHLGSGSSANVWLLEHKLTRQSLACKLPRSTADRHVLSQEAKLADSLAHENLVRTMPSEAQTGLSSAERAGATFWELLPAGSLESLIGAAGPLSIAQTVTVLLPMIQVAQYLHDRQIVHGDFSPANILFDLQGRPVLIDLGTVRASAHAFHATGTPGFVAPEISDPSGAIEGLGMAADVYSLAAIGWFCLTASSPGVPQSRMPLVTLHPEIDPDIADVLESCLSTEPALRPPMSKVLTAVARWADPQPVDLFAAVGEEYELFLPTRKPPDQSRSRHRKDRSTRAKSKVDRPRSVHAKSQSSDEVSLRRRRLLLAVSSCTLLAGALATVVYVGQVPTETRVIDETAVPESEDFQAVLDALAKARSHAWASSDVTRVIDYAVQGSEVFDNDVAVLTSLKESGTILDGIRMRAVVEKSERVQQTAAVEVEWRTDAYVQRDESADVIEMVEARAERLVLHLVETSNGWMLDTVDAI